MCRWSSAGARYEIAKKVSAGAIATEVAEAVRKYKDVVGQISDPDWKERVEEELGHYLHLLYSSHCLENEQHLFDGFDLQRYFK